MKIIIKIKEKEQQHKFPKLMISCSGNIVLFKKWEEGVIISSENEESIGRSYNNFDMSSFVDFNGEIILSNN